MPVSSKITLGTIKNAALFYEKLAALAKVEQIGDVQYLVFRGKLGNVFNSLDVSQAYYSGVRRILVENECVMYVERGGRNIETVLLLLKPPDVEKLIPDVALTNGVESATLELSEIQARLQALENWRETLGGLNIAEALRNFETRIKKLENQLANVGEVNKFASQQEEK